MCSCTLTLTLILTLTLTLTLTLALALTLTLTQPPDPQALATVLRSGVELVLVGQPCYPPPAWVEALFSANNPNPKP